MSDEPLNLNYGADDSKKPQLTPDDVKSLSKLFPADEGFTVKTLTQGGKTIINIFSEDEQKLAIVGTMVGGNLRVNSIQSETLSVKDFGQLFDSKEYENALPASLLSKLKIDGALPQVQEETAQTFRRDMQEISGNASLAAALKDFNAPNIAYTGSFPTGQAVSSQSVGGKEPSTLREV